MAITINGKSIKEIEEELRQPFPDSVLVNGPSGNKAIPISAYESRMDSVIGTFNYDFITSQAKLEQIKDKYMFHVTSSIVIYDDNRNPILTKSAAGGCNVIILTGKDESERQAKSMKSDLDTAVSESYKNCCQKLGIGIQQIRDLQKGKNKDQDNRNPKGSTFQKNENEQISVRFLSKPISNPKYISATVVDIDTGEKYTFMVLNKQTDAFVEKSTLDAVCDGLYAGKEVQFFGKRTEFRGEPQILFSSWK